MLFWYYCFFFHYFFHFFPLFFFIIVFFHSQLPHLHNTFIIVSTYSKGLPILGFLPVVYCLIHLTRAWSHNFLKSVSTVKNWQTLDIYAGKFLYLKNKISKKKVLYSLSLVFSCIVVSCTSLSETNACVPFWDLIWRAYYMCSAICKGRSWVSERDVGNSRSARFI